MLGTVADELALTRPGSVTDTDAQVRQLLALANRTGQDLMKEVDWTDLQTEYVLEFTGPTVLTGTTTINSRVVTGLSSTAALTAGLYSVTGTGMQQSARVATIDSATQVTLTEAATAAGTVSLTFTKDTFAIPADFDRYIDQTQWDRRFHWELLGPTSPQQDQFQRSGITATGPRRKFRQIGRGVNAFRIWPAPSGSSDSPATLVWEYISNNWVNKASGAFAGALTANDDSVIFPDDLLILGIKWRFWQIKGFSYGDLQAEYIDWVNREKARDGGQKILSVVPDQSTGLIGMDNVQDGTFPGRPF
jgi:hypothetical protein